MTFVKKKNSRKKTIKTFGIFNNYWQGESKRKREKTVQNGWKLETTGHNWSKPLGPVKTCENGLGENRGKQVKTEQKG